MRVGKQNLENLLSNLPEDSFAKDLSSVFNEDAEPETIREKLKTIIEARLKEEEEKIVNG